MSYNFIWFVVDVNLTTAKIAVQDSGRHLAEVAPGPQNTVR